MKTQYSPSSKKQDSKQRSIFINISLSFFSIIILFLFLELIFFRFILIAPDMPKIDFVNGIVKYKPNQQGIYRVKNEIKAQYKINSNGWNSKYDRYNLNSEKYRIAVIGDSYVEAFQINYNESIAEILENKLGCEHFQVYRFGVSGAPMSQYLHMLRKEVMDYSPNIVIIILVHNDFDESYKFKPGIYTSSFLKLKIDDNTVSEEIEPEPYQSPWYSWLKKTATWRYLAYRQKIRFQVLRNLILGKTKVENKKYQANINISTLDKERLKNKVVTEYIFHQLKEICNKNDAELLILIDGDRNSIYKNLDSAQLYKTGALSLNLIAESIARKYNTHFIDLHSTFEKDFSINQKLFNFKYESHWNSYSHEIVADVIFNYIKQNFEH